MRALDLLPPHLPDTKVRHLKHKKVNGTRRVESFSEHRRRPFIFRLYRKNSYRKSNKNIFVPVYYEPKVHRLPKKVKKNKINIPKAPDCTFMVWWRLRLARSLALTDICPIRAESRKVPSWRPRSLFELNLPPHGADWPRSSRVSPNRLLLLLRGDFFSPVRDGRKIRRRMSTSGAHCHALHRPGVHTTLMMPPPAVGLLLQ